MLCNVCSQDPLHFFIFRGFFMTADFSIKPGVCFRYVDDTFFTFGSELECDRFHFKLYQLHPAQNFTVGKEQNNSLNFLDVSVRKGGTGFLTSIYRKPTLIGQYIRWNSFSPKARRINFIKTLVHMALTPTFEKYFTTYSSRTKWQLTAAKGLVRKSYIIKVSRCKGFFILYLGGKRFVSFSSFEVKQNVQLKRRFSVEKFA